LCGAVASRLFGLIGLPSSASGDVAVRPSLMIAVAAREPDVVAVALLTR
jgi:hypothetical protein